MPTVHEQLSRQFYEWELRGRGWKVHDQPVYPEPPFVPFRGHFVPDTPVVDDGCRPSFLGSLAQKLSRKLGTKPPPQTPVTPEPEEEPEPTPLRRDAQAEFQVSLPADLDIPRDSFEQFFANLRLCREPVAFELLGTQQRIHAQFVACAEDASLVRKQLTAFFPDVQFRQQEGALESAWDASKGSHAWAVEFGLEREFMFPLSTGKPDTFIGIVGALTELEAGELALFQTLWQPVQNPWAESISASVSHSDGKPFFLNAPELTSAAENKLARPLFAVVVRILVRTPAKGRVYEIARDLASSLTVFTNQSGNALMPLQNEDCPIDYPFEDHVLDVLQRQSRRSGMILNSDELTGFVHLPSNAVRSPALQRDAGQTKAAPALFQKPPGIIIGDNGHCGETVGVFLNADLRVRHTHIIGSSGKGKSSLLLNMIRQDIFKGDGVAVLDPHGDLIDQILESIPVARKDDVVLLNLADTEFPIGFNILQAHTEHEKVLLASDLVSVFRRLSTSWGDQLNTVLQQAILAFLESKRGGTLKDLSRFLRDETYQKEFLTTVEEPELVDFWSDTFPRLTGGKSVGPVLVRLQEFFYRKPIRNMVSQQKNMLDFEDIMDTGKIFLARLPEGLCGKENCHLLGTLLVSKFQQLAMARQAQEVSARRDFWLYVDEFDHFITPSMAQILTGLRKYRFGLTLAHQQLHQLQRDSEVASAVMSQPCTRIVFGVGDDDAKKLADHFDHFEARSFKTLENFHAIARVDRDDFDFNLAIRKPESPEGCARKEDVIAASRARYARPRAEVEAELSQSYRGASRRPEPSSGQLPAPASPTPRTPVPARMRAKASSPPPPAEPMVEQVQTPTRAEVPQDAASQVPKPQVAPAKTAEAETFGKKLPSVEPKDETGHETIKNAITAEAESLDYTVTSEMSIPPHGRLDLVLTRGKRSIACEICSTTTKDTEADHIRLRLRAGFQHVAEVSRSRRKLESIRAAFLQLNTGQDISKVGFYLPEEFINQLFNWAADDPDGGELEKKKPKKQKFCQRAVKTGHGRADQNRPL